jgi:hypothetical protein
MIGGNAATAWRNAASKSAALVRVQLGWLSSGPPSLNQ